MHGGGDYNPEQWLAYPELLAQDIELMKKISIRTVTLGVFSWAKLELEEERDDFEWLVNMIQKLSDVGIKFILATPSGANSS